MKRKSPPPNDNENNDGDISRTRRDDTASNTNHTSHRYSRISRQEVNFDELPYEQEFLGTIPLDDVIICFHKMEDRNCRGNLWEVTTTVKASFAIICWLL